MRKDKEWFGLRPLHHGRPGGAAGVHDAKPLAPMRRPFLGAVKPARYRMALPEVSKLRAKRPVCNVAARLSRQNGIERRAPDAGGTGVIRSGRDQHGSAVSHISSNIVEIDDRQHTLPRVAVKDDELKIVDLLLKQLTGRECDQRQLVDGRAV